MRLSFEVKKRYIILPIVAFIIFAIHYWWTWLDPWYQGYRKSISAARIVGWAIGLPNDQGRTPHELTEELSKFHLNIEQWNKISCTVETPQPVCRPLKDKKGEFCTYNNVLIDQPLYYCARIKVGFPIERKLKFWPFDDVVDYAAQYCGVYNRNSCIVLEVNEIVLERPEMLNAIIYAAEHPCEFVPTKEKCDKWTKHPEGCNNYKTLNYGVAWRDLQCGELSKTSNDKIIIVIYDKRLNKKFHIVTKRKEN